MTFAAGRGRRQFRKAGQASGQARRRLVDESTVAIRDLAQNYRRRVPYSREHSTSALANYIARNLDAQGMQLSISAETVRQRLRKLGIR